MRGICSVAISAENRRTFISDRTHPANVIIDTKNSITSHGEPVTLSRIRIFEHVDLSVGPSMATRAKSISACMADDLSRPISHGGLLGQDAGRDSNALAICNVDKHPYIEDRREAGTRVVYDRHGFKQRTGITCSTRSSCDGVIPSREKRRCTDRRGHRGVAAHTWQPAAGNSVSRQ